MLAARTIPPPPVSTVSAPNWAAPDQTTTDIATAAAVPTTGAASTPNVTPSAAVGNANAIDARTASLLADDKGPPPTPTLTNGFMSVKPLA